MHISLWPKQDLLVNEILKLERICYKICLGMRSGKSVISMVLAGKLMERGWNVVYIAPTLDIARLRLDETAYILDNPDISQNMKKLMLTSDRGSIKFASSQSMLNYYKGNEYDIVIIDEPAFMYFKSVEDHDEFYENIINDIDVIRILVGTPMGRDDILYTLEGYIFKGSTSEMNPFFTNEALEEEFKYCKERLKKEFLID